MIKIQFNYLKIKIVVVIIAIFTWFFVEAENNYKYTFKIPIVYSNLASDKIIINKKPTFLKITLWGQGQELLSLVISRKFNYNFDLTHIDKTGTYALSAKNIRFPRVSDVEILNISEPDSIFLNIQDLVRKKIAVKPNVKINTVPGYTVVRGFQLTPDSVIVVGTRSALDSIPHIDTENQVYNKVKRDMKKKVDLITPTIKQLRLEQQEIYLFVDIQKLMEKPLTEVPVQITNKPDNTEVIVIPSSLDVILVGGVDLLLPVSKDDIFAYIDYYKIRDSKELYFLAYINKPEGVRIKDVKPKRFKVLVRRLR